MAGYSFVGYHYDVQSILYDALSHLLTCDRYLHFNKKPPIG